VKCACLLALVALSAVSYPGTACEIGKGTILAIRSADGRFTLLDIRAPAEGHEAHACLQLARCGWEWKPTSEFLASIEKQNLSAESCEAESYLVDDVSHKRRFTCKLSAPVARPFVFASQLLGALGSDQCLSPARPSTTSNAVRAQAKLRYFSLEYCLDLRWSFPTKSLFVSFAPTCDSSDASENGPVWPVKVRVIQPKATITFDIEPSQGESWTLTSVSAQPSKPYLSHWIHAVRNSDLTKLTPPKESLDIEIRQDVVTLPDLIGHWTLAMLSAERNTNDDLPLRAWMSELELGNGDAARNTLLRTECIEPTDISSCQPQ
jgi:hypothetical protein